MALQFSTTVRNARLDAVESTISTSPVLKIYTGSMPSDCAASTTGTLLCSITLPSDWMAAASSGSKAKSGTWADVGVATNTAGYFRIFESTETTAHIQGECTDTGGAGPLKLSTTSIVSGEPVTVVTFTLTDGNA